MITMFCVSGSDRPTRRLTLPRGQHLVHSHHAVKPQNHVQHRLGPQLDLLPSLHHTVPHRPQVRIEAQVVKYCPLALLQDHRRPRALALLEQAKEFQLVSPPRFSLDWEPSVDFLSLPWEDWPSVVTVRRRTWPLLCYSRRLSSTIITPMRNCPSPSPRQRRACP